MFDERKIKYYIKNAEKIAKELGYSRMELTGIPSGITYEKFCTEIKRRGHSIDLPSFSLNEFEKNLNVLSSKDKKTYPLAIKFNFPHFKR